MMFTNKDIYEKILAPMGVRLGVPFSINGCDWDVYFIDEDYTANNNFTIKKDLTMFFGTEIEVLPVKTRKEMKKEIRRHFGKWKPDWSDPNQNKWCLEYDSVNGRVVYHLAKYKRKGTIYFPDSDSAFRAIGLFLTPEWERFFNEGAEPASPSTNK